MIFVQFNSENIVEFIHYMPFDEQNGMGKTQEELLQIGALVEEIPTVEVPKNKVLVYKYNREENKVIAELKDRPLTEEEKKEQKQNMLNAQLLKQIAELKAEVNK